MSKTNKYSIVTATMNRPDSVIKMLESVEKQIFLPQEFVLVDQSKNDETRKICDSYASRMTARGQVFKYVYQEAPSLVKARNLGVKHSTGEIICFIDDDVILYEDYFEKIASYFKDPSIGGVMGNVVGTKGLGGEGLKWELRKFLMRLFLLSNYDGRLTASTFGYPIYEREVSKVMEVDLFSGYSMNFRRDLVMRHPCDEWFSGYSYREDVDLSYRISRDAKLVLIPDARFIHDNSTVNRLDMARLKRMQFKNHFYMFKKFKKNWFSWALFGYSVLGILIIDFIEWLSSFKTVKWQAFSNDITAISELMAGKL